VKAAGVNPVDTYLRAGTYPVKPPLPYTPGSDASGIILSVGEGVTGFSAGNRVYTAGSLTGTYAEQSLCGVSQVHVLPERMTFSQGAAVYVPCATAYRALFQRTRAIPGETVFVHGASGGVGIAAVQLARAAGLKVIGSAGSDAGVKLVQQQGAHHVLNHHSSDYMNELSALTGGRGVDIILEMLANVNLGKDLKVLARGGRVVVIGSRGQVEIDPRDTMGRDAAIIGMSLLIAQPEELASIHSALIAGMENGTLNPIIDEEMPLAEAARAHKEIHEPGSHGKIVLIP